MHQNYKPLLESVSRILVSMWNSFSTDKKERRDHVVYKYRKNVSITITQINKCTRIIARCSIQHSRYSFTHTQFTFDEYKKTRENPERKYNSSLHSRLCAGTDTVMEKFRLVRQAWRGNASSKVSVCAQKMRDVNINKDKKARLELRTYTYKWKGDRACVQHQCERDR